MMNNDTSRGKFSVWAPLKKLVSLHMDNNFFEMCPTGDGWWSIELNRDCVGQLYKFALDGGEAYPDPRSLYQPHGVFGPSKVIDLTDFGWQYDHIAIPSLESAVIYELHVGTFTREGSFQAIIDHLDHLKHLGVSHVELMPLSEFSGSRGWGYDGVYPFAPHHHYGSCYDFMKLVDACHMRGIGVIIDFVCNHFGPMGASQSHFAPYMNDAFHSDWGSSINFDGPYSDEVRRYFIDCAAMWLLDYHVDGLRLDATHAIIDNSARTFLSDLNSAVHTWQAMTGRHYFTIAEDNRNWSDLLSSREEKVGVDALWSDDFHHAIHAYFTGERVGYYEDYGSIFDVVNAMRNGFVFDGRYSSYRQKAYGSRLNDRRISQLVCFTQNHDQVGNRVDGKRLVHLVSHQDLFLIATLLILGPSIPMIFQGEEWASQSFFYYFTDHADKDVAEHTLEGRRQDCNRFGWATDDMMHPQCYETFSQSLLDRESLKKKPNQELLYWYRDLIRIRRSRLYDHSRVSDSLHVENNCVIMISLASFVIFVNTSLDDQIVDSSYVKDMHLLIMKGRFDRVENQNEIKITGKTVVVFSRYRSDEIFGESVA